MSGIKLTWRPCQESSPALSDHTCTGNDEGTFSLNDIRNGVTSFIWCYAHPLLPLLNLLCAVPTPPPKTTSCPLEPRERSSEPRCVDRWCCSPSTQSVWSFEETMVSNEERTWRVLHRLLLLQFYCCCSLFKRLFKVFQLVMYTGLFLLGNGTLFNS